MEEINQLLRGIAKFLEVCGVFTILFAGGVATAKYLNSRRAKNKMAYEVYRGSLGRAILLGLEFLVAGDIVGTVAIEPTFQSLGVLGLIVLIRTFLSFSLEVEITGRWPWKGATNSEGRP